MPHAPTLPRLAASLVFLLSSATLAGCPDDDGALCASDRDCVDICSRIGECVLADKAMDIRVSWTINGEAPTVQDPAACAGHADLELRFEGDSARDPDSVFYPVPCEVGTVYYDRMPDRFARVYLLARDEAGTIRLSGSVDIPGQSSSVSIDLRGL